MDAKSQDGSSFEEDTTWKLLNGNKSDPKLTGRLIGGCLDTIPRLAGTEFGTVPHFVQQSGADGTLLYLENAKMKPCDVARCLLGLRFNGWIEGLSGILIGRNAGPDRIQSGDLSYVEALQSALGEVGCPVIYDMDIGHVPPQLSLVNGALAQVELSDEHGTVVQWLGADSTEQILPRRSAI
ncbi:S66 peptidase family protein [Burkholderia cepacia]|uniref:hypothetical protein n=1 Tax=Burkholderia cepacia TaxID=292 RepID=UPI001CF1814B|nr:hypothetical protein [Burkholderia cepacia]MCA8116989.1 hypothetical protein [Burkholderia cepacia]MCA8403201.1 hypothetical protein [Burkholderia cepacia]